MNNKITIKQRQVVELIKQYQGSYGELPSINKIANTLGISVSAVALRLDSLKRKKIIERKDNLYIINS
jgi:DNA-binding Lrp family transcriptional regulator